MTTYIIFSRISPQSFQEPKDFKDVAAVVSEKIKESCPGVDWKDSYAVTGRFDVVDIVESDSLEQVKRAAMLIKAYGKADTEIMTATPWKKFLDML